MEMRKITVVESTKNRKIVINTNATTFAELKNEMDNNGIVYDGMDVMVSPGKVILVDDSSVLPHDVPWKGTTTNDLVVMLTVANKKIKSGAGLTTRLEVYKFIRQNPEVGERIKKEYKKNYTNLSTAELIKFISHFDPNDPLDTIPENSPTKAAPVNIEVSATHCDYMCLLKAIKTLVTVLKKNGIFDPIEAKTVLESLEKEESCPKADESPYSDDEIAAMFS